MNNLQVSKNIQVRGPTLEAKLLEDNVFFSRKYDAFGFNKFQNVTLVPEKTAATFIPACYKLVAQTTVEQQKVNATCTITLTFTNPTTKQVIVRKQAGTYIGYM